METRCLNCGKVLTNSKGERLESAIADSSLPHMAMDGDTTWLRCEACYSAAKSQPKPDKQIYYFEWTLDRGHTRFGFHGTKKQWERKLAEIAEEHLVTITATRLVEGEP